MDYGVIDSLSLLHVASYFGLVPLVKNPLFKRKGGPFHRKPYISVDKRDSYEESPLQKAAERDHEAIGRMLLKQGADVDAQNSWERTTLHYAVIYGHETMMRMLLEQGANVEIKDKDGLTALSQVATRGHEAMMRMLLKHGDRRRQGYKWNDGAGSSDHRQV